MLSEAVIAKKLSGMLFTAARYILYNRKKSGGKNMKIRSLICSAIVLIMLLSSLLFIAPESHIARAAADSSEQVTSLPSKYSMRDEYIVYAQHQDALGYCWNFAATMAASTTIMKATGEYYDFSELWTGISINNCTTRQTPIGKGGTLSYQYDAIKESGLMLETDLPYHYSYTVSDDNAADYYNFFEKHSNDDLASCIVYDSTTRFGTDDVDQIKSHIYNHGSIYLTFTFRKGFVESDGAYYLPPNQTNTNSNHAVSVIGWDDNFEREVYVDGATTPTVYKGAWMILNSYTETSGNDGISFVFYDDENIGTISGYKYEMDTERDLYFYDKIESGYAYPINVKGKYYGDFTAEEAVTKQKNIFYDDVNLEYSYTISSGAAIKSVDIYLDNLNVTNRFNVRIDSSNKRFYISKNDADYGQYKVIVTYGNGERTDTYLNNFFVTHGLVGEEIEFDYANNSVGYNTGLELEYYSYISPNKDYVIYTNKLSGEISFAPREQSVYSEKNMSIPKISYNIEDGVSDTVTYTVKSESGYELEYNFIFEYYDDSTLQTVNVYYDLGGGVNHSQNYRKELAGPDQGIELYAPTRPGYTFAGWYLDYGNGSKKISEENGVYSISWDDIHHLGETPPLYASSHYKKYYSNSNTVFVYAHWVEDEYHSIDLSISGNGTSQINESIVIDSDDSVRYLLKPSAGWCLAKLTINGEAIVGDEFIEIVNHGLRISGINEDISIVATFEEGVYISLKFGENIKSAYILGTKNGEKTKFYDGDVIPADYFSDDRYPNIGNKELFMYGNEGDLNVSIEKLPTIPVIPLPTFGTTFTLVVEVYPDKDGYTYVLDNITTYTVAEKGIFEKNYAIGSNDKLKEIDVGSAKRVRIEPVDVTYSVGSYVEDHYISADINAREGEKFSATFTAGQVVYLFIKKPADTMMYKYSVSTSYESIGNQWYRIAICVNADEPHLGNFAVNRGLQKYTVTWENWDGSIIYSEEYRYGATPIFNNKNSEITDYPTRPDDELYRYVFLGWDQEIRKVNSNVTYTARYEAVLKEFTVLVEPTENGTVTPDGSNTITPLDRHTYVFIPDEGYRIKDVFVNGVSVGAVGFYTFTDVNCDQTLRVEFEKIIYTVNVTSGENGSATPSFTASLGERVRLDFKPKLGYKVSDVVVDGISIGAVDHYTFVSINSDHTVSVEYEIDVVMIVIAAVLAVLSILNIVLTVILITKSRRNKYLIYRVERLRSEVRKYRRR